MEHGGSLQPQQGQWGCLEDTAVGSQPQLNLIGNGQKPFLGTLPRVDWVQLLQTRKVLKISEKEGKPGWGRAQCRRCCVWVCVCAHTRVCACEISTGHFHLHHRNVNIFLKRKCWNLYCIDLKTKAWNSSMLWISWNLAMPPQDAWGKSCRFYFWVLLTDCVPPGFHTDSPSLSLFCVRQDNHSSLTYSASSCTFLFWISNFMTLGLYNGSSFTTRFIACIKIGQ